MPLYPRELTRKSFFAASVHDRGRYYNKILEISPPIISHARIVTLRAKLIIINYKYIYKLY